MNDSNATVIALDPGGGAQPSTSTACIWCGRPFRARRGGSPKRFCSAAHRISFWSALRRWAERAVAAGVLTVDHVRNRDPGACTLLLGGKSPAPVLEHQKPAPFAPGESPDETAQLLDDLLMALLDLPSDGWIDLVEALPDELFDRIDRYLESSPVVERPSA